MKRKAFNGKALLASVLALGLVAQTVPLNVLASTGDAPYTTVLEDDVALIDGQPMGNEQRKHYYGGTYADGRDAALGSNPVVTPDWSNEHDRDRQYWAASYGQGKTTAYKFGWIRRGSNGSFMGWKFDFNGLSDRYTGEEATQEDKEAFYLGDVNDQGAMSITYPATTPQGFNTRIGFGVGNATNASITTANSSSAKNPVSGIEGALSSIDLGKNSALRKNSATLTNDNKFYPSKDGEWRNGEVLKIYDGNIDLKLEVRLSVKPSADGKYILTEYTVHNTNTDINSTNQKIVDANRRNVDGGRTVWFSSGSDIELADDDGAPLWTTKKGENTDKIEGIHGQSGAGTGTNSLASFDLLTYHPQLNLGIQKRDDRDPSKLTTWIGHYYNFDQNYYHDLADISYMANGTYVAVDSGLAYSMRFDLLPGETKTGTLAWSMKGPTYYVDPENGDDSTGNGHMGTPYQSIKKALQTIKAKNPKRVYINVMGDITLDETLTIPAGKDVTISTTDYVKDTSPQSRSRVAAYPIRTDGNNVRNNQLSIKRASTFKGDMFKVAYDPSKSDEDNARTALRFTDIIIDGNKENNTTNTGALVNASVGTVDLQTGAILKNNKINLLVEQFTDNNNNGVYDAGDTFTDSNDNGVYDDTTYAASAIELTGAANLTMSTGGVITDNTSYQGAAVRKDSTGKFTIGEGNASASSIFTIDDNKNAQGTLANTQLNVAKSADGTVSGASNQINVAGYIHAASRIGLGTVNPPVDESTPIPVVTYSDNLGGVPFSITNFPVDKRPGQWTIANANGNLDLYAAEYTYKIEYIREDTGDSLATEQTGTKITGTKIDASPENLQTQGYILHSTVLEPATGTGLSVASDGKVSGFMPSQNIAITYKYAKNVGIAKFFANGGRTTTEEIVSTVGGAPSASMPTATKTGYIFDGWYEFTDANNNNEYDDGEAVLPTATTALDNPVVLGTKYYVAKWRVSPDTYVFNTKHKNNNTSLPITFKEVSTADTYTAAITATPLTIQGYKRLLQNVVPRSAGEFDNTTYNFTGNMPIGDVNLTYTYKVDTSQKFNFTVIHKRTDGTVIQTSTSSKTAEARISARPLNLLGYELSSQVATHGTTNTSTDTVKTYQDMALLSSESVGFDSAWNFNAFMPNQDLTITYTYRPSAEYYITQKYVDSSNSERIGDIASTPKEAGENVDLDITPKYGYNFDTAEIDRNLVGGSFDLAGNYRNGTMGEHNVNIVYKMNRDPNYWKTITYAVADAPYNNGTISGTNTFSFLKNDGSADGNANAHTFEKIKDLNHVATPVASPEPYYTFDGWYLDAAATRRVEDSTTFDNDVTLYAKFVENPAYWVDINFAAGEHGTVNNTASTSPYHTWYDKTWSQILADLPSTTPEVNYLFDKWTDANNAAMQSNSTLENNATYYATFKKDPLVWGTDLGYFNPVGSVDSNGKGKIKVSGVYANNVYAVTDLNGNVIDVITAPNDGIINFTDLYPGTSYNVYEAVPGTTIARGDDISTVTGISAPKQVLIPALGNNYNVAYDENNDGKVKIVINPADPDSDYALIDENGNVVPYEDSDNGWKHATDRNNPKVVFDNLDPNATYTVVARKKDDTATTAHSKLPEGSEVIANPGDEFEVPKYIVETKGGVVETVADTTVAAARYEQAKNGDLVSIHAEATDASGNAFKYWKVMNGHNSNITGNITTTDFSFNMEATNLVLKAVYERSATNPSNAEVEDEVRGGAAGEFALDPNSIQGLENELTTDRDRELIDINGADVTYKIVFNKRDANSTEKNLVKPASDAGNLHPDAFTTAWALDVIYERYVDGRKVERATSSDASLNAVVQLNTKDIDMLDYQLFDVDTATNTATEVNPTNDPVLTAGLFEFSANLSHKYVLVYSKAFKVSFVDNNPVINHLHLNDLSRNFYKKFKIRRNESVTESYYSTDYQDVTNYANGANAADLVTPFEDIYGVQYDYVNWSTKDMPAAIKVFDENAGIKKNTVVYAYYNNNKPQVDEAREDLTDLVAEAELFADNPFIKVNDLNDLKAAIANAKEVLAKHRDDDAGNLRQANYAELQAAFDLLKAVLDRVKANANNSQGNYTARTGGNSGGGGGSAGRGKGTAARPLEATAEKNFTLGVNGTWKVDPLTGKYQYIIYGGMPLNNTWGKILTTDANGKQITDWYFFDGKSNMVTGWYKDARTNNWYYLSTEAGINNGKMKTSWLKTAEGSINNTEYWYFLDNVSGAMYRGWVLIDGKWYYFAPTNMPDGRPEGSLYTNTTTPDGYKVNANGEWIQ